MNRIRTRKAPAPASLNREKSSLDFDELVHHLDPNPEFVPQLWKMAFDRSAKIALIYQLDLRSSVPRIKKAVRVDCVEDGESRCVLIPTVFINDKPLTSTFVKSAIGREKLDAVEDLTVLLEQVGSENIHVFPRERKRFRENGVLAPEVGSGLPESTDYILPSTGLSSLPTFLNPENSFPGEDGNLDGSDANDDEQPPFPEPQDFQEFGRRKRDVCQTSHPEIVVRKRRRKSSAPPSRPALWMGTRSTEDSSSEANGDEDHHSDPGVLHTNDEPVKTRRQERAGSSSSQQQSVFRGNPLLRSPYWQHFVRGEEFHMRSTSRAAYCIYCNQERDPSKTVRGDSFKMHNHLKSCPGFPREELEKLTTVFEQIITNSGARKKSQCPAETAKADTDSS